MIKREKPFLGGFGRFSTSFFRGNPLFLQSLLLAQATAKAVTKPHLSFPLSKIYSFILSFDLPVLAVSAIYRLLVGKRVYTPRLDQLNSATPLDWGLPSLFLSVPTICEDS